MLSIPMTIPARAFPLMVFLLAVACQGAERLDRFEEALGCYRTEAGQPVLQVAPDARVSDPRGTQLAIASLRVEGDVSLLNFAPALVASDDGSGIVTAREPARSHMIDALGAETILALQRRDVTAPPVLLKRFPGPCGRD